MPVEKFMGRSLDPKTMTYRTSDGSGVPIPLELKQEVEMIDTGCALRNEPNGLAILTTQWAWKKRLEESLK